MNIFLEMATICSLSVKPTGACRLISHRTSYSTIPPRSPIPRFNAGVKCGYPPARGRAVDPCAPGECIGTPTTTTAANGLCDWHCEYANGISTRCLPPHQAVSGSLVAHRTRYDSVRRTRVCGRCLSGSPMRSHGFRDMWSGRAPAVRVRGWGDAVVWIGSRSAWRGCVLRTGPV